MKKDLLNEILKNFPEFEKDKKSLKKALEFLIEKNPEIKIDENFKKNLKVKLETISNLKSEIKKTNYFNFLIPVFSFMFVVFGFYYFFGPSNLQKIPKMQEASEIQDKNGNTIFKSRNISEDTEMQMMDYKVQGNDLGGESLEMIKDSSSNNFDIVKMKISTNELGTDSDSISNQDYDNVLKEGIEKDNFRGKNLELKSKGNSKINSEGQFLKGESKIFDERIVDDTELINSLEKKYPEFKNFCEKKGGNWILKGGEACYLSENYCKIKTYKNGGCEWEKIEK